MVEEKNSGDLSLKVSDLEAVKVMVETKCKELQLLSKSSHQHKGEDQESKLVTRAMNDLAGILISYLDEQEVLELCRNQFGDAFGQVPSESSAENLDGTSVAKKTGSKKSESMIRQI